MWGLSHQQCDSKLSPCITLKKIHPPKIKWILEDGVWLPMSVAYRNLKYWSKIDKCTLSRANAGTRWLIGLPRRRRVTGACCQVRSIVLEVPFSPSAGFFFVFFNFATRTETFREWVYVIIIVINTTTPITVTQRPSQSVVSQVHWLSVNQVTNKPGSN